MEIYWMTGKLQFNSLIEQGSSSCLKEHYGGGMETSRFSKSCLIREYVQGFYRMLMMAVATEEGILHSRRSRTRTGGLICIIWSPSTVGLVMNASYVQHIGIQFLFSHNMFIPYLGGLTLTQSTCPRPREDSST